MPRTIALPVLDPIWRTTLLPRVSARLSERDERRRGAALRDAAPPS